MPTTPDHDCARCGVNAYPEGSRSINKDGRTLVLCGHHTGEHAEALKKQQWTTVSLRVTTEHTQAPTPAGADA